MRRVLPVIVIAQLFCTSLWFAGNSVMADLARTLVLEPGFLAHLTSAVQLGFIAGTLVFAVFAVADRWSPSRVFVVCACLAAVVNLGIALPGLTAAKLLLLRGLTGFCLAGIYPVGMKIASDYYDRGLQTSLGFLVEALVLGTASPHANVAPVRARRAGDARPRARRSLLERLRAGREQRVPVHRHVHRPGRQLLDRRRLL